MKIVINKQTIEMLRFAGMIRNPELIRHPQFGYSILFECRLAEDEWGFKAFTDQYNQSVYFNSPESAAVFCNRNGFDKVKVS